FCQLGKIRKIEGFDDALLHVLALRRCIASDKNRVRSHGPPKGLGFQRDDLERLLEGDSVQFDLDPARRVIRIEKHVNSGQLADCFVNNFSIFGQLECYWNIRDRRQLDGALRFLNPLLKATWRWGGGLRARGFGSVDHLLRPPYFLLSNGAGRIDLNRLDRKSTRLNSSHGSISYAVFCLKKKNIEKRA